MTKTPKTPKTDKNIHTCGECGPTVDVDFARQLEEENVAMKNAITTAAELIDGLDLHLMGNYGMFVLAAMEKLQPFLK